MNGVDQLQVCMKWSKLMNLCSTIFWCGLAVVRGMECSYRRMYIVYCKDVLENMNTGEGHGRLDGTEDANKTDDIDAE